MSGGLFGIAPAARGQIGIETAPYFPPPAGSIPVDIHGVTRGADVVLPTGALIEITRDGWLGYLGPAYWTYGAGAGETQNMLVIVDPTGRQNAQGAIIPDGVYNDTLNALRGQGLVGNSADSPFRQFANGFTVGRGPAEDPFENVRILGNAVGAQPGTPFENRPGRADRSVADRVTNTAFTPMPPPRSQQQERPEPNVSDWIGNFFLWIVNLIFALISWVFGILIGFAGKFIDVVVDMKQLAGNETVVTAWRFVRDSLNFVFILALLGMSFGMVAGIEAYNARRMLPTLLMAALLVNFSLAIGGAFIQLSNILTATVVKAVDPYVPAPQDPSEKPGPGGKLALAITEASKISQQFTVENVKFNSVFGKNVFGGIPESQQKQLTPEQQQALKTPTSFSAVYGLNFTEYLVETIRMGISTALIGFFAAAFIFLALMLIVRVVFLVLMLILSPVPYALSVVPRASEWAAKWWNRFIQYVIFQPVVFFFLVIAVYLTAQKDSIVAGFGASTASFGAGAAFIAPFFDGVFVAVFIIVAIATANALGIYGASEALAFARRAVAGAARIGGLMPAQMAAYAGIRAGEALAKKVPAVGLAARYATAPVRAAGRVGGTLRRYAMGETVDQQTDRQKKAVSSYDESTLLALCRMGNLGACDLSMERGHALTDRDYSQMRRMSPYGSQFRDKVDKKYKRTYPVEYHTGYSTRQMEAALNAPGSPTYVNLMQRIGGKAKDIGEQLRKAKAEDFAKMPAGSLEAIAEAVRTGRATIDQVMPTAGQIRRVAEDGNDDVNDAMEKLAAHAKTALAGPPPIPARLQSVRNTVDRFYP